MHFVCPRPGSTARRSPVVAVSRWLLWMLTLACALGVLAADPAAQGKKPPAPTKAPSLTPLVTDQTVLTPALSENFGDVNAYNVNHSGDLVFLSGGSSGLFVRWDGYAQPNAILLMGDEAPGAPGTRCDLLVQPFINARREIAFAVDSLPLMGAIRRSIYIYDQTGFHRVVHSTDIAPDSGGATYGRGTNLVGINDGGTVAFSAPLVPQIGTQPARTTLFVTDVSGAVTRLVGPGDTAPGTNGGTLDAISAVALNARDEVLFTANVVGGNQGRGLFVASLDDGTAVVRKVVSHGDAIPTLGGTFDFSNSVPPRRLNSAGQVAFVYSKSGIGNLLFVSSPGTGVELLAQPGDPVPAIAGATLRGNGALLAFSDTGAAAFSVDINRVGQPGTHGLLRIAAATPSPLVELVAQRGVPAPGAGEANYGAFPAASMNATGLMTFYANLQANPQRGIFQQSAGGTPVKVVLEGEATPLAHGGTFGLALSTITETLTDGSAFFFADVLGGVAYAGTFLAKDGAVASLTSTEDPLPPGSRVSLRTFGVGASADSMVFRAVRTGGQETLWRYDMRKGKVSRIVADGDPMPGEPEVRLSNLTTNYMVTNERGDVAFLARLFGASRYPGNGIFLQTAAGSLQKVAAIGDQYDGHPLISLSWDASPPTPMNNAGQIVFRATLADVNQPGLFIGEAGLAPVKVVLGSDMPSVADGTCNGFGTATINDSGQVAFRASYQNGASGLFIGAAGAAPLKVAASNDAGPSGVQFPWSMPTQFTFNGLGEMAFMTALMGGAGGLFVGDGTTLTAVALSGAPAPSGGYFAITSGQPSPHMNAAGDLVFRTDLADGPGNSALFLKRHADDIARVIVVQGQAAPGMDGSFATLNASLNSVPGENASLTPAGEVWLNETVTTGDSSIQAYFRYGLDDRLVKVFARSDKAPQTNGTIVGSIQVEPTGINGAGQFFVYTSVAGGRASEVIYVAK